MLVIKNSVPQAILQTITITILSIVAGFLAVALVLALCAILYKSGFHGASGGIACVFGPIVGVWAVWRVMNILSG